MNPLEFTDWRRGGRRVYVRDYLYSWKAGFCISCPDVSINSPRGPQSWLMFHWRMNRVSSFSETSLSEFVVSFFIFVIKCILNQNVLKSVIIQHIVVSCNRWFIPYFLSFSLTFNTDCTSDCYVADTDTSHTTQYSPWHTRPSPTNPGRQEQT